MSLTLTSTTTTTPSRTAPAAGGPAHSGPGWVAVCPADVITPDRGVAALVDGHQVAVFVLSPPAGAAAPGAGDAPEVYAVDNHDPYSGANVIARGLVGSAGDAPTVASPIHKQRFDLRDGRCLDGDVPLRAWPARVVDGWVEVAVAR